MIALNNKWNYMMIPLHLSPLHLPDMLGENVGTLVNVTKDTESGSTL